MIYLKNKKRKNDFFFSSFTEMLISVMGSEQILQKKMQQPGIESLQQRKFPHNPPQFLLQISKTLPTPYPQKNKLKQDIFRCQYKNDQGPSNNKKIESINDCNTKYVYVGPSPSSERKKWHRQQRRPPGGIQELLPQQGGI